GVALLGDAVGEQLDVFVSGALRQDPLVGFGESGSDLRAAVGGDPGDLAFDGGLVFGAPQVDGPLEGVVEDQDADEIDGAQVFDDADGGQAGELDLAAFHGGRLVDDEDDGGAFGGTGRSDFRRQGAFQRRHRRG